MVEIGPLRRFAAAGAAAQAAVDALTPGVAADRQAVLPPHDQLVLAAVGLLAAVDGLAKVPELPAAPAARILAAPADQLRARLRAIEAIA